MVSARTDAPVRVCAAGATYYPGWESTALSLTAQNTLPDEYNSTFYPVGFSTKPPSHVPVLSVTGMTATLSVGATIHGMSSAHYISTAWVVDESGNVIHSTAFSVDEQPVTTFQVPVGAGELRPYEHCNLHGVWEGEVTSVFAQRQSSIDSLVSTGLYNGSYYPAAYSTKPPSHVPVLTLSGNVATVSVGASAHGMTASHYITAVWVTDQLGRPIFFHEFNYTDSAAIVSFTVPRGVTHLTPYEHCNLHQAWAGNTVQVLLSSDATVISSFSGGSFAAGVATAAAPSVTEGVASSSAGSVTVNADLAVTWAPLPNNTILFTVTLASTAWVGLGTSRDGLMVTDAAGTHWPSTAVTGSVLSDGSLAVQKRTLSVQDPTGVTVDAVQDLQNTSFSHEDNSTILSFVVPLSWVEQHAPGASTFNFIWAHGEVGMTQVRYHAFNKGRFQLTRSELLSGATVSTPTAPNNDTDTCDASAAFSVGTCFASFQSHCKLWPKHCKLWPFIAGVSAGARPFERVSNRLERAPRS
jgi:desulfoferrodoxin (superoxide reductase-like protein)